jgi:hypothetical protein
MTYLYKSSTLVTVPYYAYARNIIKDRLGKALFDTTKVLAILKIEGIVDLEYVIRSF